MGTAVVGDDVGPVGAYVGNIVGIADGLRDHLVTLPVSIASSDLMIISRYPIC